MLQVLSSAGYGPYQVDPFVVFTVGAWRRSPDALLDAISAAPWAKCVAVRSAAMGEDRLQDLAPGLFASVLGVRGSDRKGMRAAIRHVIASYRRSPLGQRFDKLNEVMIQRQVTAPLLAGVMETGGECEPYLHVQHDSDPGRTDAVTRGLCAVWTNVYRTHGTKLPEPWKALNAAVRAIQVLIGRRLYIEFAVTSDGIVHIFQVRRKRLLRREPLAVGGMNRIISQSKATLRANPGPWSDMADWNPAEMLGDRPRPLAVSLYQQLITNNSWLKARESLGYRGVEPKALLRTIAGKPYVDLRRSFQSLVPATLSAPLAGRLVEDRLQALRENPQLHDKVELSLLFTCHSVQVPSRTDVLIARGFSRAQVSKINTSLRLLTNRILANWRTYLREDKLAINRALAWRLGHPISRIRALDARALQRYLRRTLAICAQEGAVPFARQARLSFIARDLLNGLVSSGLIEERELSAWWRGLNTSARAVATALAQLAAGTLDREAFDAEYGHLRPRTYDICSLRYDVVNALPTMDASSFEGLPERSGLRFRNRRVAARTLAASGFRVSATEIVDFARQSLRCREAFKFAFTSLLSDVLEAIAMVGRRTGLSRDEMSYAAIPDVLRYLGDPGAEGIRRLRSLIDKRIVRASHCQQLHLPEVIFSESDLAVVSYRRARPNFVTRKRVTARAIRLVTPYPRQRDKMAGRIVLLESADPGYDWLFSVGIAGLVTRFGGSLSHMAVRCAESGTPAAIGCGALLFQQVAHAKRIRLDCRRSVIEAV